MNAHLRKALILAFGLLLLVAAHPQGVFAQTGEGVSIQPAVIEDNVKPGELYSFQLTFTNIGATAKTFYLSAQNISGLDNNGQPIFAPPGQATGYEISSWINLPSAPITLAAGQATTISLTAQVPVGVSPGAHFGGVFITDQAPKLTTNGSSIGFSVGTVMSLTVAGDIQEVDTLQEFSTDKVVYSSPDVTFDSKIQNSGNVLERPHGVIQISDMFGKTIATVDVNDSAAPVFPASERLYTAVWQATGFAFGRYEAIASFSYGNSEKQTITGTTSFWILPLGPIAIFLGSILAIVLIFYGLIRLYIRKKLREMGVASGARGDMDFYAKKYQRSGSKLIIITLLVFLFCVVFLGFIFLLFS